MKDKELISQIRKLKKIQPDKKWVGFLRSELAKADKKEERGIISLLQGFSSMLNTLRQPAIVIPSMLIIFTTGSFAAVKVAQNSLPGDTAYALKISIEKAQMSMEFDEMEKMKREAQNTDRRAQELNMVIGAAKKQKQANVQRAFEQIERQLATANDNLPKLQASGEENQEKITEVAKAMKESTVRMEEAIAQAKESLSESISEDRVLATKISDISDIANKTTIRITEIIESMETTSGNAEQIGEDPSVGENVDTSSDGETVLPSETDVPETETTTPGTSE